MSDSCYWKGIFFFFCQIIVSSVNDVITKFIGCRLDACEVTFFRFFFSLLFLFPFMFFSHSKITNIDSSHKFKQIIVTKHWFLNILRGVIGSISFLAYIYSVTHLPLVEVIVILWTIPIFSLILSAMFLHEKMTKSRCIITIASFIGLTTITVHSSNHTFYFNLLYLIPLISSFLFALQDIIISKMLVKQENKLSMLFYFALITCCVSFYPALKMWVLPLPYELFLLAILGFTSNCMQYLIFKAFSFVDVSAVAPYRYLELLTGALFAFLFFGEIPEINTIVGVFILIPSTLYLYYTEKR